MKHLFFRKCLQLFLLLIAVCICAFVIVRCLPGDPVIAQLNATNTPVTEASVALMRKELGLDTPRILQFFRWLFHLVQGDWGISYQTRRPVLSVLGVGLQYTMVLGVYAFVWIFFLSGVAGYLAARYEGSSLDGWIRWGTFLGASMPSFWLGFLLVWAFALHFSWFPVQGALGMRYVVLPSFTLACSYIATYTKLLRNSILEVMEQDFIHYSRARGCSEGVIFRKHVLPNALAPLLTTFGMHFGSILSGAVIVENLFAWPGLGRIALQAMQARDYPILQGYILLVALLFILGNFLAETASMYCFPHLWRGDRL